jgi:hypothetical protein
MQSTSKSDTVHTTRTIEIAVSGENVDRIVHGSRMDEDFILDRVVVTLSGDIEDATPDDLNVVARGRYVLEGSPASKDFGSDLMYAGVVTLALRQSLPASFDNLLRRVS